MNRILVFFFAIFFLAGNCYATTLLAPGTVDLGQAFEVKVMLDGPAEELVLKWAGKEIPLSAAKSEAGYTALALLGSDVKYDKPGAQSVELSGLINGARTTLVRIVEIKGKKYPAQHLKLPKKMVSPPKKTYSRIGEEATITKKTLSTITPSSMWSLPLVRPVPGDISSVYGLQRFLNGKPRSPHRGLDFRGAKGTPVKSVADGRVLLVGDHYFAGNCIYVDHGGGVISMYFHLSKTLVKEGEAVTAGQAVGEIGRSGRATGPHLHFGLSLQGKSVDPLPLLGKNVSTRP